MDDSVAGLVVLLLLFAFRMLGRRKKGAANRAVKPQAQPAPAPVVQMPAAPEPGEGEGYSILRAEQQVMPPSGEGEDLCDPELGHHRVTEPESVYAHEIADEGQKLDLSAQGVWQGVVMSEVLSRPAAARNHGWKRN